MILVADAARFAQRKLALVDAASEGRKIARPVTNIDFAAIGAARQELYLVRRNRCFLAPVSRPPLARVKRKTESLAKGHQGPFGRISLGRLQSKIMGFAQESAPSLAGSKAIPDCDAVL